MRSLVVFGGASDQNLNLLKPVQKVVGFVKKPNKKTVASDYGYIAAIALLVKMVIAYR